MTVSSHHPRETQKAQLLRASSASLRSAAPESGVTLTCQPVATGFVDDEIEPEERNGLCKHLQAHDVSRVNHQLKGRIFLLGLVLH